MKKLCKSFKKHAIKIINLEMKNMMQLTEEQQESEKSLKINKLMIKNTVKLETIASTQVNREMQRIKYLAQKII